MASSAAAQSPTGMAFSRLVPATNSPPSPLIPEPGAASSGAAGQQGAPEEPAQYTIGSPLRSGPTAPKLESIISDLMRQLENANHTILEMGMKGAALEKELQMRKLLEEMNIKNAVEQEKVYWEKLAAQAGRAAPTPFAPTPFPAPGIEVPKATTAKEDPLPDSWAGAAAAMGLAKSGATTASLPTTSVAVPLPTQSAAVESEDLGEPLRDPHPK